jgi:hypothetical protein
VTILTHFWDGIPLETEYSSLEEKMEAGSRADFSCASQVAQEDYSANNQIKIGYFTTCDVFKSLVDL